MEVVEAAPFDDVTNAAEFLLGDKSQSISGTVLTVDAGAAAIRPRASAHTIPDARDARRPSPDDAHDGVKNPRTRRWKPWCSTAGSRSTIPAPSTLPTIPQSPCLAASAKANAPSAFCAEADRNQLARPAHPFKHVSPRGKRPKRRRVRSARWCRRLDSPVSRSLTCQRVPAPPRASSPDRGRGSSAPCG